MRPDIPRADWLGLAGDTRLSFGLTMVGGHAGLAAFLTTLGVVVVDLASSTEHGLVSPKQVPISVHDSMTAVLLSLDGDGSCGHPPSVPGQVTCTSVQSVCTTLPPHWLMVTWSHLTSRIKVVWPWQLMNVNPDRRTSAGGWTVALKSRFGQ